VYDFETLVSEVLRARRELNRAQLLELVAEKKKNVGSGYLTDQGALFLIAGESGIQLKHLTSTDLTLKDIYAGANDITVVARVLAVYPIMGYKRKDGTKGAYRRLALFDKDDIVRLTIWDDNADIDLKEIAVDSPVRVSNGYVRHGLDGKPNLNLGKRGKIELLSDTSIVAKLPSLRSITRRPGEVPTDGNLAAAEGIAASKSRVSNFTRDDGSQGHMMQFELGGGNDSRRIRVVIWNGTELPEVNPGEKVRITNLRVKKTSQGETELHGDSGSLIQPTVVSSSVVKVKEVKTSGGEMNLEVMALSKGRVKEVILKDGEVVKKGEIIVGDDTAEITVVGWRELSNHLANIDAGEKLLLTGVTHQTTKMGTEILQLGGRSKVERVPRAA
jgi:ssDNA-binding replication factor A large subunit